MNYIKIDKLSDLQTVIEEPIFVSGQRSLINEEIYNNMWALAFSDRFIKKLEVNDLDKFLHDLLNKRNLQVVSIDPQLKATFYLWFDQQASQLRFNIISGDNVKLPFRCKLYVLDSPESILQDFVTTERRSAIEGNPITFLEREDIDAIEEEEFILDVYIRKLGY